MKKKLLSIAVLCAGFMTTSAMESSHWASQEEKMAFSGNIDDTRRYVDNVLKHSQSIWQFFHDKYAKEMLRSGDFYRFFVRRISGESKERFEEIGMMIVECLDISDFMMQSLFFEAAKKGSTDIINVMIKKGLQKGPKYSAFGFLQALENMHYDIAKLILANFKIDFDFPQKGGLRAHAGEAGCFDIVELIDELIDRSHAT